MIEEALKVSVCGISDVGVVRQNNEDVWSQAVDQRLFILADGMGGHLAGEIAARETVEQLTKQLQKKLKGKKRALSDTVHTIKKSIQDVNAHVYKLGRTLADFRGMGTTLCVLHIHDEGAIFGHVGDSRIYRLREGKLTLLTRDHSLLRELIDKGQIKEDQVGDYQYKNIITRAIGTESSVEPDVGHEAFSQGDIYLLCSDGLSDLLTNSEIEKIFEKNATLSEASEECIQVSKQKGGHDNVTLVVIQIN